MTKQRKGGVLAFVVGLAFVGLQLGFGVETGLAGLFITGVAGGLWIGDAMARSATRSTP